MGLEIQRQSSDRAIARTTPALLGLFSLVALLATRLLHRGQLPVRHDAWGRKERPTIADALATVRAHWWRAIRFSTSSTDTDMIKLPRAVFTRLTEALCYAA